jgi:hypothetical protein
MPGYDARILQGVCIAYPIRIRLGYVSMKYPKTAQIRVSDTSGPNWIWPLRGKRAFKAELITALPTRRTHRLPLLRRDGDWRVASDVRRPSSKRRAADGNYSISQCADAPSTLPALYCVPQRRRQLTSSYSNRPAASIPNKFPVLSLASSVFCLHPQSFPLRLCSRLKLWLNDCETCELKLCVMSDVIWLGNCTHRPAELLLFMYYMVVLLSC